MDPILMRQLALKVMMDYKHHAWKAFVYHIKHGYYQSEIYD